MAAVVSLPRAPSGSLGACLGSASIGSGLALARLMRDQAARRGTRRDRGGRRRRPIPSPLGPAGVQARDSDPPDGSAQHPRRARARQPSGVASSGSSSSRRSARSIRVCLPVLFRLWRGKGTPSPVRLARRDRFPVLRQPVSGTKHVIARRGRRRLPPARCCWWRRTPSCSPPGRRSRRQDAGRTRPRRRAPANAAAPGSRASGWALSPPEPATTADRRLVSRRRADRHRDTVDATAETAALWYGAVGAPARVASCSVSRRLPGSGPPRSWHCSPPTTAATASDAAVAALRRAPMGRSRPPCARPGKQLLQAVGQARNRLRRAVERTVPFEFIERTASSSSGTRRTATTRDSPRTPRRHATEPLATGTRTTSPSRACASPTPQKPFSQHKLPGVAEQLSPTRQIPRLRTGLRRSRRVTVRNSRKKPKPRKRRKRKRARPAAASKWLQGPLAGSVVAAAAGWLRTSKPSGNSLTWTIVPTKLVRWFINSNVLSLNTFDARFKDSDHS